MVPTRFGDSALKQSPENCTYFFFAPFFRVVFFFGSVELPFFLLAFFLEPFVAIVSILSAPDATASR